MMINMMMNNDDNYEIDYEILKINSLLLYNGYLYTTIS